METQIKNALNKAIWLVFLSLTIITPLIFTSANTELYEVPKMSFVYFGACLLLALTAIKFIFEKTFILPKNQIAALMLLFIAIQIASTISSIDKFTSIFGYPTRLNGGLLSQFSYFIIFTSALINLNAQKAQKLILTSVVTAFAVALIGIFSHFGYDLTCYALTNDSRYVDPRARLYSPYFNVESCWQAEFNPTLRIFSTLGQPNWLAAYLVLIIPVSLSFLFTASKKMQKIAFLVISLSLILALIFSGSRSGFAGMTISLIIFFALNGKGLIVKNRKILFTSIVLFVVLSATSGSALMIRLGQSLTRQKNVAGGTETGQIRLIVWQGAYDAFKKSLILGHGPETFAYSYSQFRPLAHNQTTEWNFFYNKAHNELLNYLANIGILGTSTYLLFLLASLIRIFKVARSKDSINSTFAKSAFAAIVGYHVAIFFGFSTVVSQLMMFLIIAFILVLGKTEVIEKELRLNKISQKIVLFIFLLFGLWITSFSVRIYLADVFFNRSKNLEGEESLKAAFSAVEIFPGQNPFYFSDLAQNSAGFALNLEEGKSQEVFANTADSLAAKAATLTPNNFIIQRRLINTYILLNSIDGQYQEQLKRLEDRLISLAPTDPQTYLTSAKIEIALSNRQTAHEYLDYALKLKPDYIEAQDLLHNLQSEDD